MLYFHNVQVFYIIIYNSNTSAFTILIIINMKDKNIETIALINCRVEGTFIHKKTSKITLTTNLYAK